MKYVFLILFAFAIGIHPLYCQLKKGDVSVSFSSLSSFNKIIDPPPGTGSWSSYFRMSPSVGYMFSDRVMFGGGLGFSSGKGYSSYFENYKNRSVFASPLFRFYYFEKRKLMPYAYLQSDISWVRREYDREDIEPYNKWKVDINGGLGIDWFFAKNLALELNLGTVIFENKNAANRNPIFFANIGLRTFINDREAWGSYDIMERYLQKGNYILSGKLSFGIKYTRLFDGDITDPVKAKPLQKGLYLNPRLTYFVKDRTAISINPSLTLGGNGFSRYMSVALSASAQKYLPVAKRLFFVPRFSMGGRYGQSKQYRVETTFMLGLSGGIVRDTLLEGSHDYNANAGLDLAFSYFTKGRTIFSAGWMLSLSNNYYPEKDKLLYGQQNLYFSTGYFILPNLKLGFRAEQEKYRLNRNASGTVQLPYGTRRSRFVFSFSLGYFIFKK